MSHLSMDELSASLDGALTGADQERTRAHLSMCPRCRDRQARLALHDDALRRLLADDPDDRAMDELARRSEAIATAIVRGLPVPPIEASKPRVVEPREYGPIETLSRFAPPAQAPPPSVVQDTHVTPARAEEPLPPPRDASRVLRRPDKSAPAVPLDITPRLDTDRPERSQPPQPPVPASIVSVRKDAKPPQPPLSLQPLQEMPAPEAPKAPRSLQPLQALPLPEATKAPSSPAPAAPNPQALPAPEAPKASTSAPQAPLAESYDTFNDNAYAGPDPGQRPPMIGEPSGKKPSDAGLEPPRKEYRHGGVRRGGAPGAAGSTPVPGAPAGDSGERRRSADGSERSNEAARDAGFGVRRKEEPAWARLGLEPDPFAPGQFRDALTGAIVTPPPVTTRRSTPPANNGSKGSRTALIATLATVGGLIAVVLVLRIPTAERLSVQWGRPKPGHPAQPGPVAPGGGKLDIHDATTTIPVDVPVTPATTSATTPPATPEAPRLCGQLVDAQGRPLAGATISVVGGTSSARCDADGRFCLAAPAGAHDVEVVDPRAAGTAPRRLRMEWAAGAPESRIVLP